MMSGIRQSIVARSTTRVSVFGAVMALLSACSGSDGTLLLGGVSPDLQSDDATTSVDDDFARPLYAVSGVWFCSVTSAQMAVDDQIEFRADGSAEFQRYGTVYWNRNLAEDRLNIHLPGSLPLTLHGIFASDQSLQFNVDLPADDTLETDEVYACVLSTADS